MSDDPDQLDAYRASAALDWPRHVTNLAEKQRVARRIADRVLDGQLIGIGSGSATYMALWAIGERVRRERLAISVVTASYETEAAALTLGIPTLTLGSVRPDWGVDGADEVDSRGRVLKGRGGALFREKLLWATCARMYLAVDASKRVERLGQGFPVPIEVHRLAVDSVGRFVSAGGARSWGLRVAERKDGPVITENGNLLIDAWYDSIPEALHGELKAITGVIETGLFQGYSFELA